MPLTPVRKAFVFVLSVAILVAVGLAASGRAAAAQNQPSWSTGDYWTYSASGGGAVTWAVQEQTTVAIGTRSYQVWHVTTSTTSGNTTFTLETWMTSALELARTSGTLIFSFVATYDPPQPQAAFPLTPGKTWQGSTAVTTAIGSISQTTTQSYSGQVLDERSISVPAGTFSVATIRTPSSGNPYTLNYYSESVGWLVKTESYNGVGTLTSTQELTSYKYSGTLGSILLIVGILLLLVIVAVVALLLVRRRRPMMPQPQYPGQYPQYPYPPPQQPPQQPPYQGPPPGP